MVYRSRNGSCRTNSIDDYMHHPSDHTTVSRVVSLLSGLSYSFTGRGLLVRFVDSQAGPQSSYFNVSIRQEFVGAEVQLVCFTWLPGGESSTQQLHRDHNFLGVLGSFSYDGLPYDPEDMLDVVFCRRAKASVPFEHIAYCFDA